MTLRTRIIIKLVGLAMSGWSDGAIEERRARQERWARYARLSPDIERRPVDAGGVDAEWFEPPDPGPGMVLYLHGGAYSVGSVDTHREFIARLAHATAVRTLAINYRLAPEHPYPAALADATAAYLWLIGDRAHSSGRSDLKPARVVIIGDSAGGGLALATLVALRDAGHPLPVGAVCISPWTDLALTGDSVWNKAHADPILSPTDLKAYARAYAGKQDLACPLISPLYADLRGLPPLLVQVGTEEVLLDDAVRCARRARQAGVDVTLETWEGMVHVFQMIPFLPEAKRALASIADWIAQKASMPGPGTRS